VFLMLSISYIKQLMCFKELGEICHIIKAHSLITVPESQLLLSVSWRNFSHRSHKFFFVSFYLNAGKFIIVSVSKVQSL
jgi:hypothetical protein